MRRASRRGCQQAIAGPKQANGRAVRRGGELLQRQKCQGKSAKAKVPRQKAKAKLKAKLKC